MHQIVSKISILSISLTKYTFLSDVEKQDLSLLFYHTQSSSKKKLRTTIVFIFLRLVR